MVATVYGDPFRWITPSVDNLGGDNDETRTERRCNPKVQCLICGFMEEIL